ncbi:MAG: 16S rRNA (uracil(1498)-N(3))-methyltransferase [Gomphosphaeria aponina SAG 52.96 = DSM 107014]|uniref:Ribosomal RNA small subunit methyltransferase E n=1 Tax=Gomphosphaeria aponina SAG 52.96 = DSM 107014 TaxID=1521640 RepID=A0A941GW70_9CHRO|nr:16S rRNA (uracil(1498)-N(3))-methyltransferase [Gomphosphaeria aponina SAG 52.96 = DSM 107014]
MNRLVIAPTQIKNGQISLNFEQQHYLTRVLRLTQGNTFVAMDGQGNSWLAALSSEEQASILEAVVGATELPVKVTLMVALPKGNGFDDLVRYCTELGVNRFMPVISDRTLLKPSPQKVQRWSKIAQEAAQQSERQIVPNILSPLPYHMALTQVEKEAACYICVARRDSEHLLHYLEKKENEIIIATGPEGGWTEKEVEAAIAAGFQPVSLGRRILRAVTAPIVASSLVAATWDKARDNFFTL